MVNRLKQIRRSQGLKQADVARDLGMPLGTYRSLEQGKRGLNDEKLVMFAGYFNVSTDELLGTSLSVRECLAARLKEFRRASGMSVAEVGESVGKSDKTISAWEVGRGQPDADMLVALSELYGVEISEFFQMGSDRRMRLSEIRQARKMTQQQVADLLGIPLRTYQNYERGVNDPDTDILCGLADYYGVSVDYLVGYSEIAYPQSSVLTPEESHLVDTYRILDDPGKHAVMTLVEGLAGRE